MTSHRTETNSETDQETDRTDQDSVFLDAITGQSNTETTQWTVTIALNRVKENFKIDTGAEVTAVTETAYQNIGAPALQTSSTRLNGPASHSLQVKGQFVGN